MNELLKKFIRGENRAELVIAGIFFVIMVVMTALNVFSRYVLQKSYAFAEEISYLGFTWSTFIGVGHSFRQRSLVAVDVFIDRLPRRVRHMVEILGSIVLLLTNIGLCYLSLKISISGWVRRTAYLRIPYTFYYLPVLIVSIIMLITTIYFLVLQLKGEDLEGKVREQ